MAPPASALSRALWNFSSQWFLIPQGTGILAVILHTLDYQFDEIHTLAYIIWVYTIVLLGLCLFLYMLRVILYPKHVVHQFQTSLVETSCLASFCIAFTTIIQMVFLQFGYYAAIASYVLWWVNAGMAVLAVFGIPYVQLKYQPPGIQSVSPATLLPYIAALTNAAAGGVVCKYANISAGVQVPVIIVSYLEIGIGLALSFSFDGIFIHQHYNRHSPTAATVYQDMILCGPFGQSSFALQDLGLVVIKSFPKYGEGTLLTAAAAKPIGYASMFAGLLSWGYGTFWWVFAIASICHTLLGQQGGLKKVTFGLNQWALIFPWVSTKLAFILLVFPLTYFSFIGGVHQRSR